MWSQKICVLSVCNHYSWLGWAGLGRPFWCIAWRYVCAGLWNVLGVWRWIIRGLSKNMGTLLVSTLRSGPARDFDETNSELLHDSFLDRSGLPLHSTHPSLPLPPLPNPLEISMPGWESGPGLVTFTLETPLGTFVRLCLTFRSHSAAYRDPFVTPAPLEKPTVIILAPYSITVGGCWSVFESSSLD